MTNLSRRDDIARVCALQQRRRYVAGAPSLARRLEKLAALRAAIVDRKMDIFAALAADLGKPAFEAAMDFGGPLQEIETALEQLENWVQPTAVQVSAYAPVGATARIIYEPKGSVLIFSPWNFPFALLLQPLAAALAAGNSCVLKPSELAPATAAVCAAIVKAVFEEDEVAIFEGGADVAEALLEQKFDHIFFTGSPQIGTKVMAAAARHLSSVTLELGGKCPVIIDKVGDLAKAAGRIAWGKYLNAGQICLAPDHVWVREEQRDEFARHVVDYIRRSYYPSGQLNSPDMARFVNARHQQRCLGLINDAVAAGARILHGGAGHDQRIEPTVLIDVPTDCAIMREEVFGPILPILTYSNSKAVLDELHRHEKPLGLYIFSDDAKFVDEVLRHTSSGGVTVNDVMQHGSEKNLPFGGVGSSGFGAYHGHYSFLELSHRRSVFQQADVNPAEKLIRPPYPTVNG